MGDGVNLSFSEAVYMLQYKEKHLKKKNPHVVPKQTKFPEMKKVGILGSVLGVLVCRSGRMKVRVGTGLVELDSWLIGEHKKFPLRH